MKREFTGRHMIAVMAAGFGIVIAVNLMMASLASSTFGGIVVENSYVASQKFNGWLAAADKSAQLGWKVALARGDDGKLVVTTGNVPDGAKVSAMAHHPLGRLPDTAIGFVAEGRDRYVSDNRLPDGRWTVRLAVTSGSDTWRGERALP